jgi:arylsulfatase A-like enzyme
MRKRFIPVLVVAAALAVSSCSEPPELRTRFPERPNILLITIDTLRADHLSAYGYVRNTSPTLDRLAAEGLRFDRPAVQWPKTGPSFTSIFTATYPKDNKIVRKIGIPLPMEYKLLAEMLKEEGYSTHAVVANGAVASEFNFHQGFDTYIESWKVEGVDGPLNVANRVTDEALTIAEGLDGEKPYFLWVHYLDPHFPYTPPAEWVDMFVGDEHYDASVPIKVDRTKARRQMGAIGRDQMLNDSEEMAFYEAQYDAEIAFTDSEIERLLEGLSGKGLMDTTLTAVTSDHGESLGEHRYYFDHGRFSFQTCLRVPFILHFPGVIEPQVDFEPVQLIDLSPTILDIVGAPIVDGTWMQGHSLLPRIFGTEEELEHERVAFSEAGYALNGNWQKIVQDERYKLILVRAAQSQRWIGGMGIKWVLYDLSEDPGETNNLATVREEDARRLQKHLVAWLNKEPFNVGVAGEVPTDEGEMDEETREQLKALGYLN